MTAIGVMTVSFIYNNTKCIAEKEIETIIEYLFNEAFIKDRRTSIPHSRKKLRQIMCGLPPAFNFFKLITFGFFMMSFYCASQAVIKLQKLFMRTKV